MPRRAAVPARPENDFGAQVDALLALAEPPSTLNSTIAILNTQPAAAWKVGLDFHDDVPWDRKKRAALAVRDEVSELNILEPRTRRISSAVVVGDEVSELNILESRTRRTTKASTKAKENLSAAEIPGRTRTKTSRASAVSEPASTHNPKTLGVSHNKPTENTTQASPPPTSSSHNTITTTHPEVVDNIAHHPLTNNTSLTDTADIADEDSNKEGESTTQENLPPKTSSHNNITTALPEAVDNIAHYPLTSNTLLADTADSADKDSIKEEGEDATMAPASSKAAGKRKATATTEGSVPKKSRTNAKASSSQTKATATAAGKAATRAKAPAVRTARRKAAKEATPSDAPAPRRTGRKATEEATATDAQAPKTTGRKATKDTTPAPAPRTTGRKAAKEETSADAPTATAAQNRNASEPPVTKPAARKKKASEPPATAPAARKRKSSEPPATASAAKRNAPAKAPAATTAAKGKAPAKASSTTKAAKGKASVKTEKNTAEPKIAKNSARGRKRKSEDDEDNNDDHLPPPIKKAKVVKTKEKPIINAAPTEKLDVYVFGEGSSGELGLGKKKNAINVKRPRLNPYILREEVGVVHVACGGMHVGAITHDNRILTWGVNDQGALGRDTTWVEKNNADDDNITDDDNDDLAFNPHECVPTAVDSKHFPEGTVFVMMACGDSFSMVLTATGDVYGWGTFRSNEGVFGFSPNVVVQREPALIPTLKNITQIVCGSNHAMALNQKGEVFIWGCGQQNQLGHRLVERRARESLEPRRLHLNAKDIRYIGCGQDHSFALGRDDRFWVWGVNSFGETSIPTGAGGDSAIIVSPQQIKTLTPNANECLLDDGETIASVTGGVHHSIAVTSNGRCFIWGRMDGDQTGIPEDQIPNSSIMRDDKGGARILIQPTEIPGLQNVVQAAIGTDHTIVVNGAGEAYSWGFNVNYQCGQGIDEDIKIPTLINNTATRGKKLLEAGGGGQYSVLTGLPPVEQASEDEE